MKRKLEDIKNLPSTKKVKLEPKTKVLDLLKEHGIQLTPAHLKSVLPELTIETTHDLLILLKDNPKSEAPGARILIQLLFSHLLTMNYEDTGPSLEDFCVLVSQLREYKKLPPIQGQQLNNWLNKFNLDQSNVQNLPFILRSLEHMTLGNCIDFFNKTDSIDIALINQRLRNFVKTIYTDTKDLTSHIYWIISALGFLTHNHYQGKIETYCIDELLSIYLKHNPKPEELDDILKHLGNLLSRSNFEKVISVTWMENALRYLNHHADAETSIKRFIRIVNAFASKNYETKPLRMEKLQPIIDRMAEGDPTTTFLCLRMNSIRTLVEKQVAIGPIQRLDAIFDKINEKELHPDKIINMLHIFVVLVPVLREPLPARCIEKFLIPDVLTQLDKKYLSVAFNGIYWLAAESKLSGQFTENFITLAEFVANSKIENLDDKLIGDVLSALGICLLNEHIDPLSVQSQSIGKLIRRLTELNRVGSPELRHAFSAFKNIAISNKFNGLFHGDDLDLLLKKFLGQNSDNAHLSICLHTLGIIARQGYLEGSVSRTTLVDALKMILNCSSIKPFILFRCFTAVSDLIAQNPLLNIEKELETIFDTLLSRTQVKSTMNFQKKDVSDIEIVLRLPNQFRGKIVHTFMPLWLSMLLANPEINVIKTINHTIDKLIQAKQLPVLPARYIQELIAVFPKLHKIYPKTLLNTLILAGNLIDEELLEGELVLEPFRQTIQKILEQLRCQPQISVELSFIADLLDNIRFLGFYDKLPGKIDVLPVVLDLIVRSLGETRLTDLESIGTIFQNIQILMHEERMVCSLIKAQTLEEILQSVLKAPGLQKDQCLFILKGLSCLIEKQLIKGHVDAIIINDLIAQLQNLDPEAGLSEPEVNILLEYNKSYSKNPKLTLIPQQLFYHSPEAKLSAEKPSNEQINSAQP